MEWDYDRERAEAAMRRGRRWTYVSYDELIDLDIGFEPIYHKEHGIVGVSSSGSGGCELRDLGSGVEANLLDEEWEKVKVMRGLKPVKVADPQPVAPQLVLTPIAPADVQAGDFIFNQRTGMMSKVVDVPSIPLGDFRIGVIDETDYDPYWLAADQRRESWAYRLEVKP